MAAAAAFGRATACGGGEAAATREQAAARSGMEAGVEKATRAAAVPSTGLWTEGLLFDRLLRTGVAPRAAEGPTPGPKWMPADAVVILAGGGEVRAWIFADSAARRAVTDLLDPATGTPAGETVPYAAPFVFVVQNNLAAFITGGRETNQERIKLALEAGLPVTAPEGKAP